RAVPELPRGARTGRGAGMTLAIDLWNPSHATFAGALATAFLLGIVHGVTPDEHTWPITFSYAIGGYSTRRGLFAGLTFSLAFTVQQALASELAYLGFAHLLTFGPLDAVIDIVVGIVMATAGLFVMGRRTLPHLPLPGRARRAGGEAQFRELKPWMPAVHGFIAGWGLDAFALILYTVLAPAMPSAATGWLPGLIYGFGTLLVQAVAGAALGAWLARRGLRPEAIRRIGLLTAARTLLWGGVAFVALGLVGMFFPSVADLAVTTPLRVHNLHTLGLPFFVLLFIVIGVGATTLIGATRAARRPSTPAA
ncbi:MAG: hypothetical protein ACREE1_20255, partial [Stellaceae bacterium]